VRVKRESEREAVRPRLQAKSLFACTQTAFDAGADFFVGSSLDPSFAQGIQPGADFLFPGGFDSGIDRGVIQGEQIMREADLLGAREFEHVVGDFFKLFGHGIVFPWQAQHSRSLPLTKGDLVCGSKRGPLSTIWS
jgi:hypothetical protein